MFFLDFAIANLLLPYSQTLCVSVFQLAMVLFAVICVVLG